MNNKNIATKLALRRLWEDVGWWIFYFVQGLFFGWIGATYL